MLVTFLIYFITWTLTFASDLSTSLDPTTRQYAAEHAKYLENPQNHRCGLLKYLVIQDRSSAAEHVLIYNFHSVNATEAFVEACARGMNSLVNTLLNFRTCDPNTQNGLALVAAIDRGQVQVVKMLLQSPKFIVQEPFELLKLACQKGDAKIVSALLCDDRFPYFNLWVELRMQNEIKMCSFLDECKKISDLTLEHQKLGGCFSIVTWLVMRGKLDDVMVLIKHGESPSLAGFLALKEACTRGHLGLFQAIMKHPDGQRLSVETFKEILGLAAHYGHATILQYLGSLTAFDQVDMTPALKSACLAGQIACIKFLANHRCSRPREVLNEGTDLPEAVKQCLVDACSFRRIPIRTSGQ